MAVRGVGFIHRHPLSRPWPPRVHGKADQGSSLAPWTLKSGSPVDEKGGHERSGLRVKMPGGVVRKGGTPFGGKGRRVRGGRVRRVGPVQREVARVPPGLKGGVETAKIGPGHR